MGRHITLGWTADDTVARHADDLNLDEYIAFWIKEQNFFALDIWTAENGLAFYSQIHPQWDPIGCVLYLRGEDKGLNDWVMTATKADFNRIQQAVAEFNEFHKTDV